MLQDRWLKNVSLSGYKSIQSLKIEFKSGLNIIIGKNGSGKTNVFEAIHTIFSFQDGSFDGTFSYAVSWENVGIDVTLLATGKPLLEKNNNQHALQIKSDVNAELLIAGQTQGKFHYLFLENHANVWVQLYQATIPYFLSVQKIDYLIPEKIKGLHEPLSFFSDGENAQSEFFASEIFHPYLNQSEKEIKDLLSEWNTSAQNQLFRRALQKFTPIEDVRFNSSVLKSQNEKGVVFSNIMFEFRIHKQWFFFSSLSDGMRRLIWIIYNLLFKNAHVFLIEEPELGIHPHQLDLLLKFLKEQSEEKQIILSTHAPQCLDIFTPQELDRIIIAEMTEKGTMLSHLDEKKQNKARKYMSDNDTLSSFWRFSDLESRERTK